MSETIGAIVQAIETQLGDVNTAIPGTVVSYDPKGNRAVVRPSLPKRLADGTELAPPTIAEVPILWPAASGGAIFTMPIKPGDGVMLIFSQRSLEGWLGGSNDAPDDPRRFDLSDAVALPGLRASGISADPDAVVLALDGSTVRLEPGGVMSIETTTLKVKGNIELTGGMTATADIVAGSVSLKSHVHTGVQSGAAISGPPRP